MAEKGVVIRPSFYEAIISMGEQNQLALFKAICCYGLYGQEPVGLSARAEALFALMKPNLDSASKRYNASVANGKREAVRLEIRTPENDLETTKAFNPGTSPIQKLKKRKRLILKPPVRGCGAERERFLLLMFRTWMITAGSRATAALADGL